jgi:hypothetical protein
MVPCTIFMTQFFLTLIFFNLEENVLNCGVPSLVLGLCIRPEGEKPLFYLMRRRIFQRVR